MIELSWIDGHADVWAMFADPASLREIVDRLVEPYRDAGVTHVAGIESRGFVLGGAAAVALGAGFVAVRKEAGHFPGEVLFEPTARDYKGAESVLRLQAHALPAGARVLVVDDWVETGSQLRAVRGLLERAGATHVGTAVVVDQADEPGVTSLVRLR